MSGKAMKNSKTLASRADRHQLYEESVQDAKQECKFVRQSFRALRGRPARILREDFCGTAAVCCQWVKRNKGNIAIGVDLDPDVLDWARQHNLAALKPDRRERVRLVQEDVTARPTDEPVDVVLAMNFS